MRHSSILLSLAALALAASANANLIVNGGFEVPISGGGTFAQYFGGSTAINGWTVTGADVLVIDKTYTEAGAGGLVSFTPNGGDQSLDITGAGNTSPDDGVTQSIATTTGQRYFVSFYVGRTDADPDDPRYSTPSIVDLSIDGGARVSYTNLNVTPGGTNWQLFTTSFVATGSSTAISFYNGTAQIPVGNNFAGLDDVSVVAAPAPGALAAFGLGLLGRVRRKRA